MSTNTLDTIAAASTLDIMRWAGCSRMVATLATATAFDNAIADGRTTAYGIAHYVYFATCRSDGDTAIDNFYINVFLDSLIAPTLLYMRNAKLAESADLDEDKPFRLSLERAHWELF